MRTGVNPFYGFLAVVLVYVSQNENKYTVNFPGLVYTVSTVWEEREGMLKGQ